MTVNMSTTHVPEDAVPDVDAQPRKTMTRVLLINPPQKFFKQSSGFNVYFPIGLLGIASMIKDLCNLKILDCLVTDFEIKKTKDSRIYGTPLEKVRAVIQTFDPDIVGVSVPFSAQSTNAEIIGRMCKDVNQKILVIFGGPDPSVRYEYFLQRGSCDFCVVGEGEKTFFELVMSFNKKRPLTGIEGLAYRTADGVHYTRRRFIENLDELPFPDYEAVSVTDYLANPYLYINRSSIHKKSISVITSRGCPYACVFCSVKLHMGRKYRYQSPEYVIKHLRLLVDRYGITRFHFEDDNLSLNRQRFERILDKILEANLKIAWDTPNGIRADSLDFELLLKIAKAGCKRLTIAIESGSQRVLDDVIRKNTCLNYVIDIVKYCKEIGIPVSAFYVVGFPGETIDDIKQTLDLAMRLFRSYSVIPLVNIATPLYGTELYRTCVDEGLIDERLTDEDLSRATQPYGSPLIATKEFGRDDLKELVRNLEVRFWREGILYCVMHPFSPMAIEMVSYGWAWILGMTRLRAVMFVRRIHR